MCIRDSVRVERDLVERENPDVIIAATGSKALIPDYIQMDEARIKVIDCRQAMENLELDVYKRQDIRRAIILSKRYMEQFII